MDVSEPRWGLVSVPIDGLGVKIYEIVILTSKRYFDGATANFTVFYVPLSLFHGCVENHRYVLPAVGASEKVFDNQGLVFYSFSLSMWGISTLNCSLFFGISNRR